MMQPATKKERRLSGTAVPRQHTRSFSWGDDNFHPLFNLASVNHGETQIYADFVSYWELGIGGCSSVYVPRFLREVVPC